MLSNSLVLSIFQVTDGLHLVSLLYFLLLTVEKNYSGC